MSNKTPRTAEQKAHLSEVQKKLHEQRKQDELAAKGGGAGNGGAGAVHTGGAGGGVSDPPNPASVSGGGASSPAGTQQRSGRNLEAKGGKPIKVEFDIEKLKKALPAFLRLLLKAFNNFFKLFNFIPQIPFKVEFEEMTQEESDLFAEAAWPGMEASLPSAAKQHPIFFLFSAFFVGLLGKIKFMKKEPKNDA